MRNDSVLVVGGTGLLGGTICSQLLLTRPVRALMRPGSRSKADLLSRKGAELIIGDLKDRASLTTACRGMHTVISTATAIISQNPSDAIETVDLAGQLALVDAAEAAGVEKFIFVSFPEQRETFPLQDAKRTVEQRLRNSRLRFTVLRPEMFQEVWLSAPLGFDVAEGRIRIYGSGEGRLSWISVTDVATAAIAAADNDDASGMILTMGGPDALSPNEIVGLFEEASGRSLAVEYIPVDVLRAQYAAAIDAREKSFFALALAYSRGRTMASESNGVLPMAKIRVRDYAAKLVANLHA